MGPEMAAADKKISIIRNDISISHCTRRITKIMSGLQKRVDQTAVNISPEKGIGFRSWISKGRKNQGTLVPEKYKRKEIETPPLRNEASRGSILGYRFERGFAGGL
jgi:hypothetical protein